MASKQDELRRLWHQYESEHGGKPSSPRDVTLWALREGLLHEPRIDPVSVLADEMARALRTETKTDVRGRTYRVNHALKITRDGVQTSLWAGIDLAPREYMQKSFALRRKQIVGDCYHLKTDIDVYNDRHDEQEPIQTVLDFTADVEEMQAADGSEKAA